MAATKTRSSIKKRVRFAATSECFLQEKKESVDRESLWYTVADLQRFSRDDSSKENYDHDNESFQRTRASVERRRCHVRHVLHLQNEQIHEMGAQDETGLRAFACALSKENVKRARDRACQYAKDAFQVYESSTTWMKGVTATEYTRQTSSARRHHRVGKCSIGLNKSIVTAIDIWS